MKHTKAYKTAKSKKVGDKVNCAHCGTEFTKTQHQQAFCRTRGRTVCKDAYWNTVDPAKRNNTTRISPANAARTAEREYWGNYDDDPSWDAHKHYA